MQSCPYVGLIGGTGAIHALSQPFYRLFSKHCGVEQSFDIDGQGVGNIWHNYQRMEARLDAAFPDPSRQLLLCGHSQGGLLAALYAIKHPQRDIRLVLIGTPLAGTVISNLTMRVPVISWGVSRTSLGQMARDSRFMVGDQQRLGFIQLLNQWTASLGEELAYRVCCVYAEHDQLVQPFSTAFVPGSTVVRMGGPIEHFLLVFSPHLWKQLSRFQAMERPQPMAEVVELFPNIAQAA